MTDTPDPLRDVTTLPGGEFVAACIDAVQSRSHALVSQEQRYRAQNKAVDADVIRDAALCAAAAAMLEQIKADGARMTPDRKNHTVISAVTAGKSAFLAVEKMK
jgi:hypothetical protein